VGITIRELAGLAGVSPATVSLVLNDKHRGQVSEAVRQRVLALSRERHYRSNQAAKALVQRCAYRIALCHEGGVRRYGLLEIYGLFNIIDMFSERLQPAGYSIDLTRIDTGQPDEAVCESLARKAVDGYLFLMMASAKHVSRYMSFLKELHRPAVASSLTLGDGLTWTDIDRHDAFVRAVELLAGEGHKTILLLDIGPRVHAPIKRHAYLRTMREALGVDAGRWVFRPKQRTFPEVARLTREALLQVPAATALLLTGNYFCDAVVHAVQEQGLAPGRDCRIVGFGDTSLADRCAPKVSHFSLCLEEEVEFGLGALMEAIRDPAGYRPRHQMFRSRYVQRGT
jgi:LacI family transcriptional regulator